MENSNGVMIVVANHSAARIFSASHNHELKEIETLSCPEARLYARELLSDSPTHIHDSVGAGRHAQEPRTQIKDKIAQQFSDKIADWLEKSRVKQGFSQLVVVAPPDFLGMLRKSLTKPCRQLVVEEVHHNLVKSEMADIIAVLPYSMQTLFNHNRTQA